MGGHPRGWVKVGYARDAKKRAAQLRKDMGLPIVMLHRERVRCEMAAMDAEDRAHEKLASFWSGYGEWFACGVDIAVTAVRKAAGASK